MIKWKHKNWETFPGTWLICSAILNDAQIAEQIKSNPKQYGSIGDWVKI